MTAKPPTTPPPTCHFCPNPSTRVMGVRPVCERCAPVVAEIRDRNLNVMLAFFRDAAKRHELSEETAA